MNHCVFLSLDSAFNIYIGSGPTFTEPPFFYSGSEWTNVQGSCKHQRVPLRVDLLGLHLKTPTSNVPNSHMTVIGCTCAELDVIEVVC